MPRGVVDWLGVCVVVLTLVPGVSAGAPVDPSTVTELSPPVRAVAGAALVLLFGAAILTMRDGLVDRSVDASLESVPHSTFYGLAVHFVIVFAGVYIVSQITKLVGGAGPVVLGLTGVGFMVAAGLGFTVVGAALTEVTGDRRPWLGLGIGTGLAAIALIALPFAAGVSAWILIASVGIGGSARKWFHASHTEVNELGDSA